MADRLELEARFNDHASAGVKKLGKTLEGVKPSNGMQAASAWMKDFRGEAEKVHKAVQPVTTTLTALGVGGLAASMSMSELVKSFKGLADGTLNMKELGRQSGMTIDQINRLNYAAGKLHVDPSAVSGALNAWSDKMVDFRRHTGRMYTEMMRQNSDVAAKIISSTPEEGFKRTLDYLSRIPAAAIKAGKSAAEGAQIQKRYAEEFGVGDVLPMLADTDKLKGAFADAGRDVKPISQSLIDAAEKLNESTNRMNQSWSNLKNDIGPSVLDPMSKLIDKLDETLKLAAANPGDAAAVVGVGALTAGALYARRRIMAGSKIAGGSGLDRAAGELTGAAGALKQAAAALEGSKAVPGAGGAPGEGGKPGGGSFDKGRGLVAALGLAGVVANAPGMDEAGDRERDANASALESFGEAARKALGVDWLQGKVDEWRSGTGTDKWSHPDDDRLSRARPDDLKKDVQEGSKAGIIQGLRELAQQQELDGGPGGSGPDGKGGVGAPSLRYGRNPASGLYRRGGHSGGGRGYADTPDGAGHAGGVKGDTGARAMAAMEYLVDKKGWTPEGAAIAVGNAIQESSVNAGTRPGDNGISHSMFQWNHERWAAFQRFSAQRGRSTADNENALDFFDEERKHRSGLEAQWHRQTDLHNAGRLGHLFEGYGDRSEGVRVQNARDTLAAFKRKHSGAGTPAPSAAAVGDAAVMAARQRILNGGRDPADRALIDRYKAQQAKPETPVQQHRAGGWIRGPGGPTADRVPAMLSNGEYVVNARASGEWGHLLHAINSGELARFAEGGPVGFGVAKAFYPTSTPRISEAEGAGNRRFWRDFFRRPQKEGGMGAPWRTTLAALAMMQGESGRGLNSKSYGWDVNGPSGGVDQLHDVTEGRGAGKLHRLSDLMKLAYLQHADWRDPLIQAANFKREALGDMNFAWSKMLKAKTARGALKEGIDKFENPRDHQLEMLRRMPNLVRLQREAVADGAMTRHEMDPLDVTISHHPHTGKPIVTARSGKGVRLKIRTGPTMQPT